MSDQRITITKRVFSKRSQRSSARLCAVQAMYLTEFTDRPLTEVLSDFLNQRLGGEVLQDIDDSEVMTPTVPPEPTVFTSLVRGAFEQKEQLKETIDASLDGDRNVERLEAILASILRVGVFEMMNCLDVPPKVIISEYVDIAHAFFGGPEPKLVNAVLDRVAKSVRKDELIEDTQK